MSSVVYNLFLRNWCNCRATEEQIDLAVSGSIFIVAVINSTDCSFIWF
ncbi:hypothetical protein QUF65_05140 [Lysinibacillus sphaericus]|nr:hypothetical protein [Lysinibacillus sphaericus]MDM5350264.1 hypothetical protein [Lysinibacillus sphaericus]MEB7455835.1 hypothetical protein [Lysinibacillus sphaericus]